MSAADYSRVDRALHRLALGSRAIAEMSFDLEKSTQRPDGESVRDGAHLFITGLARAGTTILLRRLYGSGAFGSLTYRDMPFVLAPGLWSKISRRSRRTIEQAERAHGDGLLVDADSPESLDEVFWRVFCGSDYLKSDRLVPHDPDSATVADFRRYVAAILQSREGRPGRYLSKTNNSILRIDGLRRAFPNALIVVPFRTPLAQANSLLRQHLRFSEEQRNDPFVLRYMNWLGHHEFGLGHRPFVFHEKHQSGDPMTLEYWVSLWVQVYSAVIERHAGNVHFISYDRLCTDATVWERLTRRAGIDAASHDLEPLRHSVPEVDEPVDDAILERARTVEQQLLAIHI